MRRNTILICLVVFACAFSLRYYNLAYPSFRFMDEARHVPAASNYLLNGQFETDNWEHPPLRHVILYGFLNTFGDNPHGWRMRNVLFGAFVSVLTFLFALEISGSRRAALMAGLLLATDPLHIMLSRYTYEEIYGTAFFLASVLLYLKHERRCGWLVLSALFMGCALAVKWFVLPCWLMLLVMLLRENNNWKHAGTALFISATWLLLPISVFTLSYYPWFGRGYTLTEFAEFITNAYYSLQADRPDHYERGFFFVSHTSAAEWFMKPVMVGQGTLLDMNGNGEFVLFINNLPIWICTLPALIGISVLAIKRKSFTIALPVLLFCVTYLLYLKVDRPVFLYSASTLLPFAFTAIATCMVWLADKFSAKLYYGAVVIMLTWNLYLYPLVSAKQVPVAWYGYILKYADVRMH